MEKMQAPNANNHKIINTTRVVSDIGFQPPNVFMRKCMKPTIGIPITRIPEHDINDVVNGERCTIDQSMRGIIS